MWWETLWPLMLGFVLFSTVQALGDAIDPAVVSVVAGP
jgi:hypothetical protein